MPGVTLSVPPYDPRRGVVADTEGGSVRVAVDDEEVFIVGDAAGLRDLARWCMVLSDEAAPGGSHIHLDPDVVPLTADSSPLRVQRSAAT